MNQRHCVFFRVLTFLAVFGCSLAAARFLPAQQAEANSAANPSSGGATKYDLRYQLATGEVLRYEAMHQASIRSTIDEVTQSAQTKTDSTKLWKVTDVLPGGEIEFMNVVERVHMVNQLPDRAPVEYDSERDKKPPPGFDDVARAIGTPLSAVRITPHGKVVDRKTKHHQAGMEDYGAAVLRLPDEPVATGSTWDEPLEVAVQIEDGGTKAIQTRRHYRLTEVASGIATIEITYQVLSPVSSQIESQLVQRLMSGTAKFDIARGRVVSQQMEVDKRILGFAGPTSSMQYVMRMEEKLVDSPPKVVKKTPTKAAEGAAVKQNRTSASSSRQRSTKPTRTSNRAYSPQPKQGTQR